MRFLEKCIERGENGWKVDTIIFQTLWLSRNIGCIMFWNMVYLSIEYLFYHTWLITLNLMMKNLPPNDINGLKKGNLPILFVTS